jgi:SAM-dependent methyltransferase
MALSVKNNLEGSNQQFFAFLKKPDFISKLNKKRNKLGFREDEELTRLLVEQTEKKAEIKNLTKFFVYRRLLESTFEKTQTNKPHKLEDSRHYALDMLLYGFLGNKPELTFLDVGCGLIEGVSPTTEDTVKLFARFNIRVKAIGLDLNVPQELHEKVKNEVLYLNGDVKKDLSYTSSYFGKFDYIRCVNLLYYFNKEIQEKIISKLTYLLKEGGILVEDSKNSVREAKVRLHQKVNGKGEIIFEGDPYSEN